MNKFIFLDVDGVLITKRSVREEYQTPDHVDPSCITELNRIIQTTQADVVVSSVWRQLGFSGILHKLRDWGFRHRIHSLTPVFLSTSRGQEIKRWFDKQGINHKEETFVIIDDEGDMDEFVPNLVRTDPKFGLTKELANEVIRRLNKCNK